MKVTQGDLLQLALAGQFDVIVHGCNCQCQMGKGIALILFDTFISFFLYLYLTAFDLIAASTLLNNVQGSGTLPQR